MSNMKRMLALLLMLCMVIPMCLINVSAAKLSVDYKFYDESVETNEKGVSAFLPTGDDAEASKAAMDILNAKYDTNKALPLSTNASISKGMHIYNGQYTLDTTGKTYCLGINDVKAKEWIAIKIKSPGAGTFDGTVRFYRNAGTKAYVNVYILPGNTTDIGSALTAANRYVTGFSTYAGLQNGLHEMPFDKQFQADGNSSEYIVVFQMDSMWNNETKARFYLDGMKLTESTGGSNTPTPTTPTPTTPPASGGTVDNSGYKLFHSSLTGLSYSNGRATLSQQLDTLNNLYANGSVKMVPYGWNTAVTPYLNYGAQDTTGNFGFNGIFVQKAKVGDWFAFKFKSPGTGLFSVSLDMYYLNDNNAFAMNSYLLPGNTASANIGSLLTDDNKLGAATVMGETPDKTMISTRQTTGAELEAGKDYILVVKITGDNHNPDTDRVDFFPTGLTFGEGYEAGAGAFGPVTGEVAVEKPISYAEVYRAYSSVHPVNGHELMYLAYKGGMMQVYDVDDNKIVGTVTGMANTPFDMDVDKDGNCWFAGSGSQLHFYNPTTGEAKKYAYDKGLFDGLSHNTYGVCCADDGYIYFTYWGWIGRLDPVTGEFINLSGTQIGTTQDKASDAQFAAYGGMYYKDGYLYFGTYGDLNADLEFTSEFVKYDIANKKVVQAIDIRDATHGSTKFAYGITLLNRVGDILVGSFSARPDVRVVIDISGEEMVRLETLGNFDTDFIGRFTTDVDGKYYFTGYVDNENVTKCIYEYDPATKTVKRLGDIYLPATMSCKFGTATVDGMPGTSIITYLNNTATGKVDLIIYNPQTGETVFRDGISGDFGSVALLQTIAMDSTGRYLYTGAYGTSKFAQYDLLTGELYVRPGYSHQTDGMIWYEDNLWIGNYNIGCITRYDPVEDEIEPLTNLMGSVFQQKRMWANAAGGGKVFYGTVPDTGRFGGALMWYDIDADLTYVTCGPNPEDVYYADTTDSFVVWRNALTHQVETFDVDGDSIYDYDFLVSDKGTEDPLDDEYKQRFYGVIENRVICHLQYKDGYLYGATTKYNGQNIDPSYSEGNAQIFVYDVNAMKVVGICDLADHIEGLENPSTKCIDFVDFVTPDPYEDGKFWGLVCDTLFSFTFDTATCQFTVKEELSFEKGNAYKLPGGAWCGRTVVFDGDYLYVTFHNYGVYMVNTSDPTKYYEVTNFPVNRLLQPMDGNLYYISGSDGTRDSIKKLDVAQYTQPLVAQSVIAVIDSLPETATMENEKQFMEAYKMYMDLMDSTKDLVTNADALLTAVASLEDQQAAKADGLIDAIGEVTLQKEPAILTARDYYDSLPEGAKAKVTKLSALEAAEAKLAELKQDAYKNPPVAGGSQGNGTTPAPKGNTLTIVIIAVAAVAVIGAVAVVLILNKKKKKIEE